MPDKEAFGPDMKWSEEARAKRSEAAKKAAATRKAKREKAEAAAALYAKQQAEGKKQMQIIRVGNQQLARLYPY